MSDQSKNHNLVTKDDLTKAVAKLATKDELRKAVVRLATKTELKRVEKSLRGEILRVEERVESLEEGQEDIKGRLIKLQNTMDKFVGNVDELRTENLVGSHQTRELQVQVKDHEERIKKLESSRRPI